MIGEKPKTNDPLEPFLLLGKGVRGAAATKLVLQAIEAPNVFVFGELLQVDGIKELELNDAHSKYWKLLQLYAFGTYKDYQAEPNSFPELNELQIKKLRLLTIATLASKSKFVSYKILQENLGLDSLRNLEDLIIEAVYADMFKGKINQKEQRVEVDFVIGRDIQPRMIDEIITTLGSWSRNCEEAMEYLDTQSGRANVNKESKTQHRKNIEQQVDNTKKLFRSQDMAQIAEPESSGIKNQKVKPSKSVIKSTVKSSTSRTK